jgi:hypothetical protein
MSEPTKGVVCQILCGCDSANRRKFQRVTLLCAGGVFEPDEDAPGVRLVRRHLFGRDYVHAEPIEPPPPDRHGYMASGNFIHTSDARFHEATGNGGYPVALHDHSETPDYR